MILLGRVVTLHQLNNIILYFILQVDTLTITKQPGDEHRVTSWIASAIVDVEVTQEGDWWLIFGLRLIAVII